MQDIIALSVCSIGQVWAKLSLYIALQQMNSFKYVHDTSGSLLSRQM